MQRKFEGFKNVILHLEGLFERGVNWERVLEIELNRVLAELNFEREEQKLPLLTRVPDDTWRFWHEQVRCCYQEWKRNKTSTRGSK